MSDQASGEGETLAVALGEPRRDRHPEGLQGLDVPIGDLSPGTLIGVEVGPERAVPSQGFAPIVPNDAWESEDHSMPRWCVRRGGIVPRLHRPEHFLLFDLSLPSYRRCPRCGWTIVIPPRTWRG